MSALHHFKDKYDDITYRGTVMRASFMVFVKTFFPLMTGRKFRLANQQEYTPDDGQLYHDELDYFAKYSHCIGREPYQLTMARELRASYDGELGYSDKGHKYQHVMINIPPRYGKTSMLHYFVAWCFANNPACNFLYISYEKDLAALQTLRIREIIQHPEFFKYFGVQLSSVSKAKEYFETTASGSCYAAGSGGAITGRGAGVKGSQVFAGAMIWDDLHKPLDVTSDTMRNSVIDWIYNTAMSRLNDPSTTPIWCIGQTLHESDAYAHLFKRDDVKTVRLPVRDQVGNMLDIKMHTPEMCAEMERLRPYEFWAQYMQSPQPAGGGIFKPDWFVIMDMEPNILRTFITVDTAETDKSHNDATVFSLWGVYKIRVGLAETGIYGLHWMDCREMRVEPKDLEPQFYAFYMQAMRERVQPDVAAIEKKSTGTSLISVLKQMQGLRILEVERYKMKNRAYTKIDRFLECQPFVAARRISFTRGDGHVDECIEHMRKITANDTHAHDDIADTLQTAIQVALIEGTLLPRDVDPGQTIKTLKDAFNADMQLQKRAVMWD
jgi:predicted phage terminase large subunit-like protein